MLSIFKCTKLTRVGAVPALRSGQPLSGKNDSDSATPHFAPPSRRRPAYTGLQGLRQLDAAASLCEARDVALHWDALKVRALSSHVTYSQSALPFERNQHGFIRGGSSRSHVLLLAEAKHIRALDRVGRGKYQDRPWPPLQVQTS